jgi:hypothetical protein
MTLRVRLCHLSGTAAVAAMLAVPHPAKGANFQRGGYREKREGGQAARA